MLWVSADRRRCQEANNRRCLSPSLSSSGDQVRPADAEVRAARGEHVVVIGSQPAVLQRSALGVQDFCEVLDLDKLDEGWTPLPAEAYAAVSELSLSLSLSVARARS